jgi:dTDP-4-dehydrorhamnose reductase
MLKCFREGGLTVKVLITGATGQVGRALLRSAPPQVQLCALGRDQLDLCDPTAIRRAIAAVQPAVIINAAAYTAVDAAESEQALAYAVNAEGPRHLAEAVQAIPQCRLLHISTDYVFDGRADAPYAPGATAHPLNVYGHSKLLGEQAVLQVLGERALVLRTAWVYSTEGKNFLLTMLRLMREHGAVRVVSDQYGTPTTADSIARALWRLAELPQIGGILHWTDDGAVSWCQFARAIAEDARGAGVLTREVQVTPIATADYPTAARRPARSVLDTREAAAQMGLQPIHWRESLRATLAKLSSG